MRGRVVPAGLALLLVGAPALLLAQPHAYHTFALAPLEECQKLGPLSSAERIILRDHLQLRQSKRRREMELRGYLDYKQKGITNDTVATAMWNSSRTLEDLQQELDLVKTAADHFENKVVEQWNNISARLQLDGMSWRDAMPCIMGRLSQHLYPYRPRLSILLQYWKRPAGTVNRFMEALMQCKEQVLFEVIVNIDHPRDADVWLDWAYTKTPGMVVPVFSYNVHEIRSYNRAAAIARAPVLTIVQDDMIFETDANCTWMHTLVNLFQKCDSVLAKNVCLAGRTFFKDPDLNVDFQFVGVADYAPYSFRRAAFMDIGGLDEGAAEPGECGIISDWEVSSRMWLAGWQVGYTWIGTRSDGATGGTHIGDGFHRCWNKQQGLMGHIYGERVPINTRKSILKLVQQSNFNLTNTLPNNECPYHEDACAGLPYGPVDPKRGFGVG